MSFRQLLNNNRIFFLTWLAIMLAAIVWVMISSKGEGVLFLNQFHTNSRSDFFIFMTRMGEHPGFLVVLCTLLVFREMRYVAGLLLLMLLVVGITSLLKHWVFPDAPRPASFLGKEVLNLIDKNEMTTHSDRSFPSGHTTAGFAFFSYLAFAFRNSGIKLLALFIAGLVALSRVYLVQHFVQDVLAGGILGTALAIAVMLLFTKANWTKKVKVFDTRLIR